ncbi:hypothetical protein [Chenggangzhangella methanolivorans]|uniref:Uncharacterized protein n=1 Tax=Chenggangzhangella methanolivorans TaxID=1437009 RepID=A0A9E6RBP2_9HYPH|nr:hypothetical protein [Chenggangzhangella methanolivorans]QZO00354.1 hypothetical protein K6K41_00775 [Chenggangzhangella methanolivorans]
MTIFDDADSDVGERETAGSFRQILVQNAVKKALTPAVVASCLDDQIIILFNTPTEVWANAVMGRSPGCSRTDEDQRSPSFLKDRRREKRARRKTIPTTTR